MMVFSGVNCCSENQHVYKLWEAAIHAEAPRTWLQGMYTTRFETEQPACT